MAELGVAWLTVLPDTSGFGRAVKKALGDSDAAAGGAGKRIGEKMGGAISGALKRAAQAGVVGVGAVAGAALAKGFGRLTAIDNARAKLSGLGHDAQGVQSIMDSALKSVKGTAFGLDEAASLAGTLVASGIKPGTALEKTLALVGDSATIAGRSLGDMGLIWSSVAAKGKLQGDDAMQLLESGIPVWQLVGDVMGVTAGQAQELGSKGQVSFETFQKAMEQGLGGSAQKSGETFTGALKNVWAALGRLGASTLESAFEQMPGALEGIISALDGLAPVAERAGKALGDGVGAAIEGVQQIARGFNGETLVTDLGEPLHQFGEQLRGIVAAVGGTVQNLMPVFAALGQIIGATFAGGDDGAAGFMGVLEQLAGTAERVSGWLGENADQVARVALVVGGGVAGFKALSGAADGIGRTVGVFKTVRGAIGSTIDRLKPLGRLIGSGLTSGFKLLSKGLTGGLKLLGKGLGSVVKIAGSAIRWVGKVINITKIWQGVQKALNLVMRMNPIGLVVTAVMLLVGAFIIAYRKSETFRNIVDGALRWVGDAFSWLWDRAKAFWDWLTGVFTGGAQSNADAFTSPWQGVKGFFSSLWQGITGVFTAAWEGIKAVFTAVTDWIGQFFADNWKTVLLTALLGPFGLVLGLATQHWEQVKGFLLAAGQWLSDTIGQIMGAVSQVWGTAWGAIRDFAFTIWEGIKTGAGIVFGALRDTITAVFSAVAEFLSSIWGWIRDTVLGVIAALRDGAVSRFTALRDGVVALAQNARDWVMDRFRSLKTGVEDLFRRLVDAVAKIWGGLKDVAKAPVKFVIDTVINKGLIGGWNWLADKFLGGKGKLETVKLPDGFARGGRPDIVPGSRSRGVDSTLALTSAGVPIARVDPGEGIIRRAALARLDRTAPGAFEHINRYGTLPGLFHGGRLPTPGPIRPHALPYYGAKWAGDMGYGDGSPVVAWHDGVVAQIKRLTTSYGNHIRINHGALGQSLYAHLSRILVSAGQQVREGQKIGEIGHSGNVRPAGPAGAHLHFEIRGGNAPIGEGVADSGGGGVFGAIGRWITDKIGAPVEKFLDQIPGVGPFLDLAKGVGRKALDGALEWVRGKLSIVGSSDGAYTGPVAAGVEQWRPVVLQALRIMGLPDTLADTTLRRMNQESSGNPNIVNNWDSNAARGTPSKGLMQVIQPTYDAYHHPLYDRGLFDPLSNILASMRYALARYGSLPAAYNRPGGYWRGTRSAAPGWHLVGERGPELVRFGGGERVLSAPETEGVLAGGAGNTFTFAPVVRADADVRRQFEDFMWDVEQKVGALA